MAYGPQRYMYENLITSVDQITADTQEGGAVSLAELTTGSGAAVMVSVGPYTGDENTTYYAVIDDISPGVSVGQATFKWRTTDTSGWEATGVTTSSTLISLNNGVQVLWNASITGDDFALGDVFIFYANADFGTKNLFDLDVNSVFRSEAVDNLVFDFGSAKNVTAFILRNHNLTAGNLQANATDAWGAPSYDEALVIADPLILYLNETYRYWRLEATTAADAYVQIGELYLGTYLELVNNAWWDSQRVHGYTVLDTTSQWAVTRRQALNQQQTYRLAFGHMADADVTSLLAMQTALINTTTTGKVSPVFVHLFSDDTETVILADWNEVQDFSETYFTPGLKRTPTLTFVEQVEVRV